MSLSQPAIAARMRGRSPTRWRGLAAVGLLLALAGLAIAGGLAGMTSSSAATTTPNPADARGAVGVAPALPADGAIFHRTDEVFRRHGPAAAEIASWNGIGALPETYIQEVWVLVDSESKLVAAISEIRDTSGSLIQRTRVTDGEAVTEGLVSGETERVQLGDQRSMLRAPATLARDGWAHYEAAFNDGSGALAFVQIGGPDGTFAIFSEKLPPPEPPLVTTTTSDGVETSVPMTVVPFYSDLELVEIEKRVAFDDATHEPRFQETVGLTSDGSLVVLESTTWLTWETLPAASWDSIVESTSTKG